jgi:molybdenum-dependent DNA-binding transcriptional regulator ModE
MTLTRTLVVTFVLAALSASPALAQQQRPAPSRPELLSRLTECRSIADAAQRLSCYDAAASALDTAERQGDVVVIDRAQIGETRRQLFGFQLPSISLFERGETVEQINAIETTLTRANQIAESQWLFTLADGGVWRQIDSERVRFENRAGQPVRVRRGLMGSYLLTVGDSRAVRVRRQ